MNSPSNPTDQDFDVDPRLLQYLQQRQALVTGVTIGGTILFMLLALLWELPSMFLLILGLVASTFNVDLVQVDPKWQERPYIRLRWDELHCSSLDLPRFACSDMLSVTALPHKPPNGLQRLILPYWQGRYVLRLVSRRGIEHDLDLSPLTHSERLHIYQWLQQRLDPPSSDRQQASSS